MPIYLLSPSTILVVEVIIKLNNMIDKKIEEAKEEIYEDRFLLNGEEVVFDNDTKEEMFYKEDIKEAIGLGAKLAINELLNNLWHPASEKPREFAEVLAEAKITESIKTYICLKIGMLIVRVLILLVGCILMIYYQRREVNNENICVRCYAQRKIHLHIKV